MRLTSSGATKAPPESTARTDERSTELQHLPLRDVGRPHRDALSGLKASEQRTGTTLSILE
jgi:hypothetical protein